MLLIFFALAITTASLIVIVYEIDQFDDLYQLIVRTKVKIQHVYLKKLGITF